MEDKIKNLEQKNREYQQANNNLIQELCKSREREQSLEKLFVLAFTCLTSANGLHLPPTRELLNQQYITGTSNVQGASSGNNRVSSITGNSSNSGFQGGNEQIVLRNDQQQQNDLISLINRVINQPGLLNQLLSFTSGYKNSSTNSSSFDLGGSGSNHKDDIFSTA